MEEVVQNMMQYKTKIDQLKQEKSSLAVTYEVSWVLCEAKGMLWRDCTRDFWP